MTKKPCSSRYSSGPSSINDLIGKTGYVQIGIETFNGIKRNKVIDYLEPEEDEEDDD